MLLLALALTAAAPTLDDTHLLTELIGAAAAQKAVAEVLTGEDVRRAVDLESERQTLGCSASSCLAEIANAMGARVVLYSSLSTLGDDELILTLTLFDSTTATSTGRTSLRGRDLKAIVNQIDGVVGPLVEKALAGTSPSTTKKTRLLILDVELRNTGAAGSAASSSSPAAPAPPPNLLLWGGIGAGVVGVVGVAVGGIFDSAAVGADQRAREETTTQKDASDLFVQRDQNALIAGVGYVVGGVLVVGGAALAVVGVQE
ncbi:MAG: hypothetical protein Q8O67_08015 [Deltaproteobacteria bacterium]|nr:hypothetical protein [Deltaproteobacteria bacterium]